MNAFEKAHKKSFQLRLCPADRLTIHGRRYRVSGRAEGGVFLQEASGASGAFERLFTWDELDDLLVASRLKIKHRTA